MSVKTWSVSVSLWLDKSYATGNCASNPHVTRGAHGETAGDRAAAEPDTRSGAKSHLC